jgi:hypothetical protein
MAEVLKQQVKLMGPKNPKVCLSGYLAPIFGAKRVLTQKESQQYQYTIQGGDPEASEEKEEEEEKEAATETESEAKEDATPDTSGEDQVEDTEPPSGTHVGEQPTGSAQGEQPDDQIRLAGREQEAQQSQSPAHSIPAEPAGGQEAQGESTPDPNLELQVKEWQGLQAEGLWVMSSFSADMTLAQ